MKRTFLAIAVAVTSASGAFASSDLTISSESSSPNGCLNVMNPISGKFFRQAEIDTSEMMDYLGQNGFKKVVKKRGACQTTFSATSDRADVNFVYSTITGEFVGFEGTMFDDAMKAPDNFGL
jgi:hypothetical protein